MEEAGSVSPVYSFARGLVLLLAELLRRRTCKTLREPGGVSGGVCTELLDR